MDDKFIEIMLMSTHLALAGTFSLIYCELKNKLLKIENAPKITVQDLDEAMKDKETIPYVAVTGRVFPVDERNTIDTITGMPAVISEFRRKGFQWIDYIPSLNTSYEWWIESYLATPSTKYVPFALSSTDNISSSQSLSSFKDNFLLVDDISRGTFKNLLVKAKTHYTPGKATPANLIASLFRGFHTVGVETSEEILPVGTVITVLGQVTKLSGNNGFRVSKCPGADTPFILTSYNMEELKRNFRGRMNLAKFIIGVSGGWLMFTLLYKLYTRYKDDVWRWICLHRVSERYWNIRLQRYERGLDLQEECVVCLRHLREYTVRPCGHLCLCWLCATVIQANQNQNCPVCRGPVDEKLKINL